MWTHFRHCIARVLTTKDVGAEFRLSQIAAAQFVCIVSYIEVSLTVCQEERLCVHRC